MDEWCDKLLDTQALLDGAAAIMQSFVQSTRDSKDREKFVSAIELIGKAEEYILEVERQIDEESVRKPEHVVTQKG